MVFTTSWKDHGEPGMNMDMETREHVLRRIQQTVAPAKQFDDLSPAEKHRLDRIVCATADYCLGYGSVRSKGLDLELGAQALARVQNVEKLLNRALRLNV